MFRFLMAKVFICISGKAQPARLREKGLAVECSEGGTRRFKGGNLASAPLAAPAGELDPVGTALGIDFLPRLPSSLCYDSAGSNSLAPAPVHIKLGKSIAGYSWAREC
jgi:hypothetical protein